MCFGKAFVLIGESESARFCSALPDKAVYLFDPDENDSHPLEPNVFTIVASPPHEKHYKALFKKGANVRYFPCGELEELMTAKPLTMVPEEIKER